MLTGVPDESITVQLDPAGDEQRCDRKRAIQLSFLRRQSGLLQFL
jgi:hypothetical protein